MNGSRIIIVGNNGLAHRAALVMSAFSPVIVMDTIERTVPPHFRMDLPLRIELPKPVWEHSWLDALTRNCNGFMWPGNGCDLLSKRKRFNWYLDHLATLRGDRVSAFHGIRPAGKRAARRWGARAREQRDRRKS